MRQHQFDFFWLTVSAHSKTISLPPHETPFVQLPAAGLFDMGWISQENQRESGKHPDGCHVYHIFNKNTNLLRGFQNFNARPILNKKRLKAISHTSLIESCSSLQLSCVFNLYTTSEALIQWE